VNPWLADLRGAMADATVKSLMLDATGDKTKGCLAPSSCTTTVGTANHARWPDGLSDGGGHDWEPTMLDFLRAN
jgi:hypothetical protein